MKLRYKLLFHIVVYVLGIITAIAIPIIKWSVIAPCFGRIVDVKKTIDGMALKEGVVLVPNIEVPVNSQTSVSLIISQEYPSSQGYGYQQSIDLTTNPAVITYKDDWQAFWLGIGNVNSKAKNFKNPVLFINFHGKVRVKNDPQSSIGWVETDPNFTYFLKVQSSIQPGQGIRLNPLFVKFPKEGNYGVSYSITTDNELPVYGEFNIKVVK